MMKSHKLAQKFTHPTPLPLLPFPTPFQQHQSPAPTKFFRRTLYKTPEYSLPEDPTQKRPPPPLLTPSRPPPPTTGLDLAEQISRGALLPGTGLDFAAHSAPRRTTPRYPLRNPYQTRLAEQKAASLSSVPSQSTSPPPARTGSSDDSTQAILDTLTGTSTHKKVIDPKIRMGPTSGRSVAVDPARGMDLGKAMRRVDTMLRENNVRRDFVKQRFHVRKGQVRKDLKRERWRRQFKESFSAAVGRVMKMQAQGW